MNFNVYIPYKINKCINNDNNYENTLLKYINSPSKENIKGYVKNWLETFEKLDRIKKSLIESICGDDNDNVNVKEVKEKDINPDEIQEYILILLRIDEILHLKENV